MIQDLAPQTARRLIGRPDLPESRLAGLQHYETGRSAEIPAGGSIPSAYLLGSAILKGTFRLAHWR